MKPFSLARSPKIIKDSLPTNSRAQVNKTDTHVYGTLIYKCLLCGNTLEIKNVPNIESVATGLCQCVGPDNGINVGVQPCYHDGEFDYMYLKYLYHECKPSQIGVMQFIGATIQGQIFLASSKQKYDASKEKTISF